MVPPMDDDAAADDRGRLWGVLRSQLDTLSIQNIRKTAGAAGFNAAQIPATSEAKSGGFGSRAEVMPALDDLLRRMTTDGQTRVLRLLARRLLENPQTATATRSLIEEQGFQVIDGDVQLASATRSEAYVDELTKIPNVKAFNAELASAFAACAAAGEPLSLVLFDIDKFKSVNDDNGGHAIGNEALVAVAELSAASVRQKGTAYRIGGDEFAITLPNHTVQEALAVAERVRRNVARAVLTSKQLSITLSMGVAEFPSHAQDVAGLQAAADKAQYDSKGLGRNLVRAFGEPPPGEPAPTGAGANDRAPERREPEPSNIPLEVGAKIKAEHFQRRVARCPNDGAVMKVTETDGFGPKTGAIYVMCPMCGFSGEIH